MTRRLALAPKLPADPEPSSSTPAAEASTEIIRVPHSAISRSPHNPRKTFDAAALEELADSIAREGLMQNLVVRLAGEGRYEIVAGERRWRAIGILVQRGKLPADTPVPVLVKAVADLELLLAALQENLEREDMLPLEEAEAFLAATKLSERGDGATAEIAQRLGKTQRWVQQRIALASRLCPGAKKAMGEGLINLEQAKAFLAGSPSDQAKVLKTVLRGRHPFDAFNDTDELELDGDDFEDDSDDVDADEANEGPQPVRFSANDIRSALARNLMPVAAAIFPLEQYTGAFTGDDEDPARRYFADAKAAAKLQDAAIEALAEQLRATHASVTILRGNEVHSWSSYRYRPATKKDKEAVAFIRVLHDRVDVREQLVLSESHSRSSNREDGSSKPAAVEPCLKALLAEAHRRKSATLQDAIAGNPALALRVACLQLLAPGSQASHLVRLEHAGVEDQGVGPKTIQVLDTVPKELFRGFASERELERSSPRCHDEKQVLKLWQWLLELPAPTVTKLHAALVAAQVRTFNNYNPSIGDDDVVLAIAAAAGVTHAASHAVGEEWLKGYRKPRLVAIAKISGAIAGDKTAVADFEAMTSSGMRAAIMASKTRGRDFVAPELYFGSAKELEARAAGKSPAAAAPAKRPAKPGAKAANKKARG